jgi:hypothetical protein
MIATTKNIKNFHTFTKEDCFNITKPLKTNSYSPVSHEKIITETLENLYKHNLKVKSENYILTAEGNQMVACFNIEADSTELEMRLMAINSYDKSISVGYATGLNVIVCSNGVVKGDLSAFKKKHRGLVDTELSNNIIESVNLLSDRYYNIEKDVKRIKEVEIDLHLASKLVGQMFIEEDLITVEQVSIIKKELEFSEHFKFNGSLWNFYNNCTQSFKHGTSKTYLKQHEKLHNFILNEFELV